MTTVPQKLAERLRNLATREETIMALGEWGRDTALLFGAKPESAFLVGHIFAAAFRRFCDEEIDQH